MIQLIGMSFGILMIYFTFLHFKRNEFTMKEFVFWLVLFVTFMILSLFPNILDYVVLKLNIARTLDLFIIAGFMLFTMKFVVQRSRRRAWG